MSFLSLLDLNSLEVKAILNYALTLKLSSQNLETLKNKHIGLLFEKPSTRTYTSFYVSILELGGNPILLNPSNMQLTRNENIIDTVKVLEQYLHGLIIRAYAHSTLETITKHVSIPIVNALSDTFHPCQALADCLTFLEYSQDLEQVTVCFLGDAQSNVCSSLILASSLLGFQLNIATTPKYAPQDEILNLAPHTKLEISSDIKKMLNNADYLYTDVWFSMGQADNHAKMQDLMPFQINAKLLEKCTNTPFIMHCLPAHYDQEITKDILYSKQSVVFKQAANKLYAQKSLLHFLFKRS